MEEDGRLGAEAAEGLVRDPVDEVARIAQVDDARRKRRGRHARLIIERTLDPQADAARTVRSEPRAAPSSPGGSAGPAARPTTAAAAAAARIGRAAPARIDDAAGGAAVGVRQHLALDVRAAAPRHAAGDGAGRRRVAWIGR